MNSIITNFKYNNITFNIKSHIDYIGRQIKIHNTFYELDVLEYILKNIKTGGTIIDVGANIGNHTIFFSKICAAKVISIEPIIENYNTILDNIMLNKLTNCLVYNNGISIDGRNMGTDIIEHNMGKCNLIDGGNKVKTITANDLNISEVKLIKIDCEAMSLEVLMSFMDIINKYKPDILIEATDTEIVEILKLTKYKIKQKFIAKPPNYYLVFE